MTESYPSIDNPPTSTMSEAPESVPIPPVQNAILITHSDQKAAVDISAALTVEDVKVTLLSVFNMKPSARVIVKRTIDGAVVVPGPKLPPGEYTLEEIESPFQIAFKTVKDKHLPYAKQQLTEKHIPFLVNTTKTGAEKVKGALAVAQEKTGQGLSVVGTHVNRGLATAGTHVSKGLATAGTHLGGAMNTAGFHIRGQVVRATNIANAHAATNSHTWTAQLWSSLVRCAPGPMAWITGLSTEELLPEPLPVDESVSETVPLSKPAEVTSAA